MNLPAESLAGYSLPGSFGSMWRDQDPTTSKWIVSSMRDMVKCFIWHAQEIVLASLRRKIRRSLLVHTLLTRIMIVHNLSAAIKRKYSARQTILGTQVLRNAYRYLSSSSLPMTDPSEPNHSTRTTFTRIGRVSGNHRMAGDFDLSPLRLLRLPKEVTSLQTG